MKNIIKLFLLINLILPINVFAQDILAESYKIYPKDADTLFLSAISVLSSEPRIAICEIQSKNGYVLFSYNNKYYLLTVTKRYQSQSEIKVLPQNSNYSQGSEVAQQVFALLDNSLANNLMRQIK